MFRSAWWQRFVSSAQRPQASSRRSARRRSIQPRLELLENRLAPATIIVTTTSDDFTPNDGRVSLREAITAINAGNTFGDPDIIAQNPGTFGTNDTINFAIGGTGLKTINVGSSASALAIPLPIIIKQVTINGYTQTGASANTLANGDNAVLLIELNGSSAGAGASGLVLPVGSNGCTIRGLAINRFTAQGILVQSNNNFIAGNFIGTNAQGNAQQPNQGDGIQVANASNNTIGGTTADARNVISGNGVDGIHIVGTTASPATGNVVQGNFIGVNAAGTGFVGLRPNSSAQGNTLFGIEISGGNGNTIGGATAAARNVIGFNTDGIEIDNGGQNNVVQGNSIGVGADGATSVGNVLHGIALRSSGTLTAPLGPGQASEPAVSGNIIGLNPTTLAGLGNLIEFNGSAGVAVFGNPAQNNATLRQNSGNSILGNSMFQNGRTSPTTLLGIDLTNQFVYAKDDGITPNDGGKNLIGNPAAHGNASNPNNFQNFPVLTAVTLVSGGIQVTGTLTQSVSKNTTYRIEFFANNTDPAGGVAEGQTFIGTTNVTTDANGKASLSAKINTSLTVGQIVTATATNTTADPSSPAGSVNLFNTSEFSAGSTVLTAAERFVQALYQNELGRSGSLPELDFWVGVLNGPGGSTAVVASTIVRSAEARDRLVKGWYMTYLGRSAGNGEQLGWVNQLLAGQTEEQVSSQILGSTEFFNHAQTLVISGTAQPRFVQALYQLLLGRTGGNTEVAFWVNQLPSQGQRGVVLGLETSTEFRTVVANGYYSTRLHRMADSPGAASWVASSLDLTGIRIGIESSPEFFVNG